MNKAEITYLIIVVYLLIMNVVAYILFKRDKRNALDKQRRISERVLFTVSGLGGALGSRLAMRICHHKTHHWDFRIFIPLLLVVWLIPVCSISIVFFTRKGPIHTTCFMMHRSYTTWSSDEFYSRDYTWVDYDAISPTLTRAVIASEDNLFLSHHGFSKRGINQAWKEHQQHGTVKHGGSTISQQTAKNVFTAGKKTYWRKMREAWYTALIEYFWGKQRIMEVYLNVIEMGEGLWGAEAASQCYFHHSAKNLTSGESALLAACLPNPLKYSVLNPGPYVQRRKQQILNLMPKMGQLKFE